MSGWGVPVAAVVVLATCLAGQTDPARDVQQLQAKDAVKAEIARRALCLLDRGSLPTDKLVALLSSASPRVRNDAVSVLMCHGVAKDELHKLLVADTDPGVKR